MPNIRIVKQTVIHYNETMKKFAYAKINLTLEILGRKPDGYHKIKSVFQKISLSDIIEISSSEKPRIEFTGFKPAGETTIHKALHLFEQKTGIKPSLRISIKKRIPTKSGLGGGSSDAATILLMLNKLYGNPLGKKELKELAQKIGADVPFFLDGKTALVEGIGERILPLKTNLKNYFALIAVPDFGYSTEEAYKMFDLHGKPGEKGATEKLIRCFNKDCTQLESLLYNDFEEMLKKTDKKFIEFLKKITELTGKRFSLTGSGSAIFTVYRNRDAAKSGLRVISNEGFKGFVSRFK